jgi:hypothetical protein
MTDKILRNVKQVVLEEFYSNTLATATIVEEELFGGSNKELSPGAKGLWVLQQVLAGAKRLFLTPFILSHEAGGVDIPVIPERSSYVDAHLEGHREVLASLRDTFATREEYIAEAKAEYDDQSAVTKHIVYKFHALEQPEDIDVQNASEEEVAAFMKAEKEYTKKYTRMEKEVADTKAAKEYRYKTWMTAHKELQDDMKRIRDIELSADREGGKQYDDDKTAVGRVRDAMYRLRNFLTTLLKHKDMPREIKETVIGMSEENVDPYEDIDMRGCVKNLADRYRNGDELDIASLFIANMHMLQQPEQSLSSYFRDVAEDFVAQTRRMGVHSIRTTDIAAMFALGGMKEEYMKDFLETEVQIQLTLDSVADEDQDLSLLEDDDGATTKSRKKVPHSLYGKTRAFIKKVAKFDLLQLKLGKKGKQKKDTSTPAPAGGNISVKEAQRRVREAQQVLTTVEVNTNKKPSSNCFTWERTGACPYGDKCRFLHPAPEIVKRRGRVCQEWKWTGKCMRGAECEHVASHTKRVSVSSGEAGGDAAAASTASSTAAATKQTGSNSIKPSQGGKAANTLFSLDTIDGWSEDESGDDSVTVGCVLVQESGGECVAAAEEVDVAAECHEMLWDSGATIHVAKDLKLLDGGGKPVKKRREAMGVGGARPITHVGPSKVFDGLEMVYIDGGSSPNLMSIGRVLQPDSDGMDKMAIFTGRGAVRFKVTPRMQKEINAVLMDAERSGLVEGHAMQRNFVYRQSFGGSDEVVLPSGEVEESDLSCAVSVNMFAGRVHLDSTMQWIAYMANCGMNQETMLAAVDNSMVAGIPEVLTKANINHFFKHVGKQEEQLTAEIVAAPLREPNGYQPDPVSGPGSVVHIDNVDPPFSRAKQPHEERDEDASKATAVSVKEKLTKKVVPSIGGYKDGVLAVDAASGFAALHGRESKKNPQAVVKKFVDQWIGRWDCLDYVKADKEFVTVESIAVVKGVGGIMRQSVPGDHRRNTGLVEGTLRWIQDIAQGNMNNLKALVKARIITELEARSLWFHALQYAVLVWNFRPAWNDPSKTRLEVGTGERASLANTVIMPFGSKIVGKKLRNDEDGRGTVCLYVGPSSVVRGGILTYGLVSKAVSCKYSFVSLPNVSRVGEAKARAEVAKQQYGRMCGVPVVGSGVSRAALGDPERGDATAAIQSTAVEVSGASLLDRVDGEGEKELVESAPVGVAPPAEPPPGECVVLVDRGVSMATGTIVPVAAGNATPSAGVTSGGGVQHPTGGGLRDGRRVPRVVVSDYSLRRKPRAEFVGALDNRPPKPQVPSRKACAEDPLWWKADLREAGKLNAETVFLDLPVGPNGRHIRPANAIVLRLLRVREYKWKPDPESPTKEMRWLECSRFVCNGSTDKRPINFYAETPDRILLFLMTSVGATIGEVASQSDCERAYLNALSIDRNIVIIAPSDIKGVPRECLLNKGLYGSRAGALSWQQWIDDKMLGLGFEKLMVARSVYKKRLASGELMRALRHSDDFRTSSRDAVGKAAEEKAMREQVRMAEFAPAERFLGCTFEFINEVTGKPDPKGKLVLVRQEEKIAEMQAKFSEWHSVMNPKGKVRKVPLPRDAIRFEHGLDEHQARVLGDAEKADYQSLVGCISWISGSTRVDCKFGHFLVAIRLSKPRMWDMYLAVHIMDYMVATIHAPLVLGGPRVDPEVYADASFGNLDERRSVVGHVAMSCPGSGAIYASVSATKCAVTSIFEAELVAGCEAVTTGLYVTKMCEELEYPAGRCRQIWVDNEAEVEWIKGSVSNKRSRHIDVKFYFVRHMQEQGEVSVEYVKTEDNIADILTKPLEFPVFYRLAGKILGHDLIRGFGITGAFE